MKLITAIIKPFRFSQVRDALTRVGIQGLSVTEVKGFGRQKGQTNLYRGSDYQVNFLPKCKIEIAVSDEAVENVVEVIVESGRTGKVGDGKIFVFDLPRVVRIRTGETGQDAV